MAFENGREVYNYIGKSIEAYKENPNVFDKITQLTVLFTKRADWPHCIVELNNIGESLLGNEITSIINFSDKYLKNEEIIWPENVPNNFKRDLQVFYLSVGNIFKQYWNCAPMKLYTVTELNDYENPQILRFIRNDGKFLDLQMGNLEINKAIELLKKHLVN